MSAYIEIVILDNLLMDYLLLWATGLFFIPLPKKSRLWTAAAAGTVYAVLAPMKDFIFLLNPAIKVLVSLLLVFIAFGIRDWRKYLKQLAVFWLLSVCVGGLVSGLGYIVGETVAVDGVMAVSGPPLWALLLLAFTAAKLYEHLFNSFRRRSARANGVADISFGLAGANVHLTGFFDTGNSACEPLSGLPAIIVSMESLRRQLGEIDEGRLDEICGLSIPYRGLTDRGMMRGFIPEDLRITPLGGTAIEVRTVVAFTKKVEGFDALIPSSLAISFEEGKYAY